jgi:hypothetical protein
VCVRVLMQRMSTWRTDVTEIFKCVLQHFGVTFSDWSVQDTHVRRVHHALDTSCDVTGVHTHTHTTGKRALYAPRSTHVAITPQWQAGSGRGKQRAAAGKPVAA